MRILNQAVTRGLAVGAALLLLASLSLAVPTPEQREQVSELSTKISLAGNLFNQGNYRESAEEVQAASVRYSELAELDDAGLQRLLQPLEERLASVHANLEIEGLRLPPLVLLNRSVESPEGGNDLPSGQGMSFVNHVVPVLITKCGRCHVTGSRGDFNMGTYTALMQSGKVQAGLPTASEMIKQIESGDMPKGDVEIFAEEYQALGRWIAEGALFDGNDPNAPLAELTVASADQPAVPPPVANLPPQEDDGLFASVIAPMLAENCMGCHGNINNPRGGLRMDTYTRLMAGGDSGEPILPGDPDASLLIGKLKGTADGARMPMGSSPLSDELIAKIEQWIASGARFEGQNPQQPVTEIAALSRAMSATPAELSAERVLLAQANWDLCMPNIEAEQVETDHFLLMGKGSESTLRRVGQIAEAQHATIATMFYAPEGETLTKGRMTLFLFSQRYDYSEFGTMVEQRQLPSQWRGHWQYSIIDAYGATHLPREDEISLEALIGQQIAGIHVSSLGSVPRWFAEGAARVAAERIDRNDPRVKEWDELLSSAIAQSRQADDFITGRLPPEQGDIVAYGFVKELMSNRRRFTQLISALREGTPFDEAFGQIHQGTPSQVGGAWVVRSGR